MVYWRQLEKAFEEASQIILFGYSGLDTHLNNRIRLRKNDKKLLVVEWSGAGEYRTRVDFWKSNTSFNKLKLTTLDNILEFTEWN